MSDVSFINGSIVSHRQVVSPGTDVCSSRSVDGLSHKPERSCSIAVNSRSRGIQTLETLILATDLMLNGMYTHKVREISNVIVDSFGYKRSDKTAINKVVKNWFETHRNSSWVPWKADPLQGIDDELVRDVNFLLNKSINHSEPLTVSPDGTGPLFRGHSDSSMSLRQMLVWGLQSLGNIGGYAGAPVYRAEGGSDGPEYVVPTTARQKTVGSKGAPPKSSGTGAGSRSGVWIVARDISTKEGAVLVAAACAGMSSRPVRVALCTAGAVFMAGSGLGVSAEAVSGTCSKEEGCGESSEVLELQKKTFIGAAVNGDLSTINEALDGGGDPNIQTEAGHTALILAASKGHSDVVKLLLSHPNIKLNIQTEDGDTALIWAADRGHSDVVELLLSDGRTDPNIKAKNGDSALILAAGWGTFDVVKLLLSDSRTDPNIKAENGDAALIIAANTGRSEVVKLLLADARADLNIKAKFGHSALFSAADKGYSGIVKLLLVDGRADPTINDDIGNIALMTAASKGHSDVVKLLLEDGRTDPNIKAEKGYTALIVSADQGQKSVVELLLADGRTDPNIKSKNSNAALTLAADKGYSDVVKLLLSDGRTDPNIKNIYGDTALMIATENGNVDIQTMIQRYIDNQSMFERFRKVFGTNLDRVIKSSVESFLLLAEESTLLEFESKIKTFISKLNESSLSDDLKRELKQYISKAVYDISTEKYDKLRENGFPRVPTYYSVYSTALGVLAWGVHLGVRIRQRPDV